MGHEIGHYRMLLSWALDLFFENTDETMVDDIGHLVEALNGLWDLEDLPAAVTNMLHLSTSQYEQMADLENADCYSAQEGFSGLTPPPPPPLSELPVAY